MAVEPFWMCLALDGTTLVVASFGETRDYVMRNGEKHMPGRPLLSWNFVDDLKDNQQRFKNWLERNGVPADIITPMTRQLGEVLTKMFDKIGREKGWKK